MKQEEPKLKLIFGDKRIVGLAGNQSSGKTNNLVSLIVDLRKFKKEVPVYVYCMPEKSMNFLKGMGVKEISSLNHLIGKKDSIIILDQYERLHLNAKWNRPKLMETVDFIYHKNNYLILSSPNIREFNSIIGGV